MGRRCPSGAVALFNAFVLHRSTADRVHVGLMGDVWIEPVVQSRRSRATPSRCGPILPPRTGWSSRKQLRGGLAEAFVP
jgi:hypothetical protein